MTLFWGRNGDCWMPKGGRHVPWPDLAAGDLIASNRKPWRVVEVRPVPVVDWDEHDRQYFDHHHVNAGRHQAGTEETWEHRPLYVIARPAGGGKLAHRKIRPYARGRVAYVFPEHYPVCKECGELYPCRELEIRAEAAREMLDLEKWEKILPGFCWGCSEPVTHRQNAIRFDGDNLYLPGAPPPVFHARRSRGCRSAAMTYEDMWVKAGEGRRPRLSCPGRLIVHVDGAECSEDPHCPGPGALHRAAYMNHTRGGGEGNVRCLRCADARARGETASLKAYDRDRAGRTFHERPDAVESAVAYCADAYGFLWTAAKTRDDPTVISENFYPPAPARLGGQLIAGVLAAARLPVVASN